MATYLQWCERWAPEFGSALPTVAPAEVERVVATTGLAVPPVYRTFVRTFGHADLARLAPFFGDIELGCDAIEAFYADPPVPIYPDAAYLWTASGDCEMFLGTGGDWEAVHPLLSFGWGVDPTTGRFIAAERAPFEVARSLFTFLYREGYEKLMTPRLGHRLRLRENVVKGAERSADATARRVARFLQIADRLGFRPLPYLDPNLPICEREDAAIALYGEVEAEDGIKVDATSLREARRLAEILADNLGARPFG